MSKAELTGNHSSASISIYTGRCNRAVQYYPSYVNASWQGFIQNFGLGGKLITMHLHMLS